MTRQRALRLAREWAQGHKCTLRDGEAAEYHSMFAAMLEESMSNEPLTLEQAKKEKYIWFEPLKDWGKVTPDGVLFFGTEERMRWETLNEYWGDPFKVYRYPPEGNDNV